MKKTLFATILCLLSVQVTSGINTQAATPQLNAGNNSDQLILNTPAFGTDVVNLQEIVYLHFSWQRPSNLSGETQNDIILELSNNPTFSLHTWKQYEASGSNEMFFSAKTLNSYLLDVDPQAYRYPSFTVYARCLSDEYVSNVIEMNVKVYSKKYDPMPQPWYFVGDGIGSFDWYNDVSGLGNSMYPMNILEDGTSRFTGYFHSGDNFMLVGVPGQWEMHIGSSDDGPYNLSFDGYGNNISVNESGWYTFEVDTKNRTALGKNADDSEWFSVGDIFINSDNNGNHFVKMSPCDETNEYNHVWFAQMRFYDNDFIQFSYIKDGSEMLMGASGFPFDFVVSDNQKIPVKAGSYVVFFDHLTGYYQFNDATTGLLAAPLTSNDAAAIPVSSIPNIDLSHTTTNDVKVCDFTLPQDAELSFATLSVANQEYLSMNANGEVNTRLLKDAVANLYGKYGQHKIECVVKIAYQQRDLVKEYSPDSYLMSVMMQKMPVEEHYYYIGNQTGWDRSNTTMPMTCLSGDQWATDSRFYIDIPIEKGQEDWFCIFPASAQTSDEFWGNVVRPRSSEDKSGSINIADTGISWHLTASEQACTYRLILDFNKATYQLVMNCRPVEQKYYYIGDRTGWTEGDTSMPLTCLSGDQWATDPRFYIDLPMEKGRGEWLAVFPESAISSDNFWYNIIRPCEFEAMSGYFDDMGYGNSWHVLAPEQDCTYRLTLDFNQRSYDITTVPTVATSIAPVVTDRKKVPATYDLQGRRISTATSLKKGIYIIDGKKVVVK